MTEPKDPTSNAIEANPKGGNSSAAQKENSDDSIITPNENQENQLATPTASVSTTSVEPPVDSPVDQTRRRKRDLFLDNGPLLEAFDWGVYLEHTESVAAPEEIFFQSSSPPHNPFLPGYKLAVPDLSMGSGTICIATVTHVCRIWIRVILEGTDNSYVGIFMADDQNIRAIVPEDDLDALSGAKHVIPSSELRAPASFRFSHTSFLKFRSQQLSKKLAPKEWFQPISNELKPSSNKFAVGHKLEVVDVKNFVGCTSIGTIVDIDKNTLRINFEGYTSGHDIKVNYCSREIFPCGYSHRAGINMLISPPLKLKKRDESASAPKTPNKAGRTTEKSVATPKTPKSASKASKSRTSSFSAGAEIDDDDEDYSLPTASRKTSKRKPYKPRRGKSEEEEPEKMTLIMGMLQSAAKQMQKNDEISESILSDARIFRRKSASDDAPLSAKSLELLAAYRGEAPFKPFASQLKPASEPTVQNLPQQKTNNQISGSSQTGTSALSEALKSTNNSAVPKSAVKPNASPTKIPLIKFPVSYSNDAILTRAKTIISNKQVYGTKQPITSDKYQVVIKDPRVLTKPAPSFPANLPTTRLYPVMSKPSPPVLDTPTNTSNEASATTSPVAETSSDGRKSSLQSPPMPVLKKPINNKYTGNQPPPPLPLNLRIQKANKPISPLNVVILPKSSSPSHTAAVAPQVRAQMLPTPVNTTIKKVVLADSPSVEVPHSANKNHPLLSAQLAQPRRSSADYSITVFETGGTFLRQIDKLNVTSSATTLPIIRPSVDSAHVVTSSQSQTQQITTKPPDNIVKTTNIGPSPPVQTPPLPIAEESSDDRSVELLYDDDIIEEKVDSKQIAKILAEAQTIAPQDSTRNSQTSSVNSRSMPFASNTESGSSQEADRLPQNMIKDRGASIHLNQPAALKNRNECSYQNIGARSSVEAVVANNKRPRKTDTYIESPPTKRQAIEEVVVQAPEVCIEVQLFVNIGCFKNKKLDDDKVNKYFETVYKGNPNRVLQRVMQAFVDSSKTKEHEQKFLQLAERKSREHDERGFMFIYGTTPTNQIIRSELPILKTEEKFWVFINGFIDDAGLCSNFFSKNEALKSTEACPNCNHSAPLRLDNSAEERAVSTQITERSPGWWTKMSPEELAKYFSTHMPLNSQVSRPCVAQAIIENNVSGWVLCKMSEEEIMRHCKLHPIAARYMKDLVQLLERDSSKQNDLGIEDPSMPNSTNVDTSVGSEPASSTSAIKEQDSSQNSVDV